MLARCARGDDSGRPYVIFAAREAGKRIGCWGTRAMSERRVGMWRVRMSWPAMVSGGTWMWRS